MEDSIRAQAPELNSAEEEGAYAMGLAEFVRAFGKLDLALNAAGVMDGTDPSAPQDFDNQKPLLPAAIHLASDD